MKKLTTILLALMVVLFTQCKKDNIDNTDTNTDTETRKVKVRCEIPLGNGTRSDFSNLMTDGSIKWSTGTERIYLAVNHETNAQIVELTAETTQTANVLAFEGEVDETILTDGETYNVWYLGNSMNLETPYVTKTETAGVITSVNGSIATQSGSLEDLGHHHIAKAEVTATMEADGSYTLPLRGKLQNQIAIAYMDLTNVTKLSGDAIIGTDYSLEYSDGEYNFVINNENNEINITPKSESESMSESFVVLLPNVNTNVDITNNNYHKYTFKDGIAANSFYYRYISNVELRTLKWEYHPFINGYEFVDLGLPSGLKWATCNVGANNPEEYGKYYSWGGVTTKTEYKPLTSNTYGRSYEELQAAGIVDGNNDLTPSYDAATANWGGSWRMPTKAEYEELLDNCAWEWTIQNGVNGLKITGQNGNSIFLPAAGYRDMSSLYNAGSNGYYWSSTPDGGNYYFSYGLDFSDGDRNVSVYARYRGLTIRPVSE